jgi:hypothetical protein
MTSAGEENRVIGEFIKLYSIEDADRLEKMLYQLSESILRSHKNKDLINRKDVVQAFADLSTYVREKKDKDELESRIRTKLFSIKNFEFYYPIYGAKGFPDGYKIGKCVIRRFEFLPEQVKHEFSALWELDWRLGHSIGTIEEALKDKKKLLFVSVQVCAMGRSAATEKAESICNESLNLLRALYSLHFDLHDYCYLIKETGEAEHQLPVEKIMSDSEEAEYDSQSDVFIGAMNEILTKNGYLTELEEKIINAVRLIGVSTSVPYEEIRFVILCSALEAMLLTNNDRDYLGWKLSERAAFLLSGPEGRAEISEAVSRLYNKRSRFVHQDKNENITGAEYTELADLVYQILGTLVHLRMLGYEKVSKSRDPYKSIADRIDMIKYSADGSIGRSTSHSGTKEL